MVPTSTRATVQLSTAAPGASDAVAVFVHKQPKAGAKYPLLPKEHQAFLGDLLESGAVRGKSNEVTVQVIPGRKPRRLVVIGLADPKQFSVECLREGGATLAKAAARHRLRSVAVFPPDVPEALPAIPGAAKNANAMEAGFAALTEGLVLGSFDFDEYHGAANKSADKEPQAATRFTIIVDRTSAKTIEPILDRARVIAEAQNFARTIASRPGNNINPPSLANVAQDLAREVGLTCRILDEKEMNRLGMGGILAVGAGSSHTPPRMVVLEYKGSAFGVHRSQKPRGTRSFGNRQSAIGNPVLVVGKSITFDSGGISIKPAEKMGRMIFDKSGGMAVLGLMYAVAKLKPPVGVVGILAAAENILSETSYRPGDILRMYNGVTVEVTNTDAEGRLVLGDALAWGIETYKPAAVVDLATLTGGVVIALGKAMAGVMSNDDALVRELTDASEAAGERIWRLPIWEEHRELMKSDPADIVNAGPSRDASPLQGGAFLSYFVPWQGKDAIPWAHLDIAGVADTEKELPLYAKGATGWGVRTLVEWVRRRAGQKG